VFMGKKACYSFSHLIFSKEFSMSLGLDPNVTVNDVMMELRRQHLVPNLRRVRHMLYFPPCRHGPLELHERLVDLGVSDLSTLYLRAGYLGGASDRHRE
jgi:hypothetical protein